MIPLKKDSTSTNSPKVKERNESLSLVFLKASVFVGLFFLLLVIISSVFIVGFGFYQLNAFSQSAQISKPELYQLAEEGFSEPIIATNDKKNILILGVDAVANRQGDPLLTDTIMLMSLDTYTLDTYLLSLPRDLWNEEYQTKINALYHYGQDRYPNNPEYFPTEVLMDMTGVPIHHTLVLTLDDVAKIIDALGGIEITVEEGFTDPQFPRDDVDIKSETDPQVLYEVISFEEGKQVMDGQTALKYIRSRHSTGDQGTDDARAVRQQQVIGAVAAKALSPATVLDAGKLGALFSTYQQTFGEDLPITQLMAVARRVAQYDFDLGISIHRDGLSIQTDQKPGVIVHPPISMTQDQWAYVIVDETAFKKEIWEKLQLNHQ